MNPNITFICSLNKTRSQFAEHIFNSLNKNKNYKATSQGVFKSKPKEDKDLNKLLKKHNLKFHKPKTLDNEILKTQKYIIIVASDAPKSLFKGYEKYHNTKIIQWNIKAGWQRPQKTRQEKLEAIYQDIEKKIKVLIKKLNNK